jgi:hypothetical protein
MKREKKVRQERRKWESEKRRRERAKKEEGEWVGQATFSWFSCLSSSFIFFPSFSLSLLTESFCGCVFLRRSKNLQNYFLRFCMKRFLGQILA